MSFQSKAFPNNQKQTQFPNIKLQNNPLFSPSTSYHTHIQLQKGYHPNEITQSQFNQLFIKPLPSSQPEVKDESVLYKPNTTLDVVKTNLRNKFDQMPDKQNLLIDFSKDKEKDGNKIQLDFISSSNSQSSSSLSYEEKSLIENLTPIESNFSKRTKKKLNKEISFEGVIELLNYDTNQATPFKAYKEDDVFAPPINYNFLLPEVEDEGICSEEAILTKATFNVLTELFEAINYKKKEKREKKK